MSKKDSVSGIVGSIVLFTNRKNHIETEQFIKYSKMLLLRSFLNVSTSSVCQILSLQFSEICSFLVDVTFKE
jgi:hypothetical protein